MRGDAATAAKNLLTRTAYDLSTRRGNDAGSFSLGEKVGMRGDAAIAAKSLRVRATSGVHGCTGAAQQRATMVSARITSPTVAVFVASPIRVRARVARALLRAIAGAMPCDVPAAVAESV